MPRWIAALAVVILAAPACEQPPAEDASPTEGRSADIRQSDGPPVPFELSASQESGRAIYETMCWTCHGEAGRGNGPAVEAGSVPRPPSFFSEPLVSLTANDLERRFRSAFQGEDPTHPHMRYVASLLKEERFGQALSYIPVLTWPPEIPGSAMAGRARYENLCAGCHGSQGEGNGPASESLLVPPVDFHADTLVARRDFEGVFQRIREGGRVHGTSMPPWGVMLSEEEIWDLVAYVASFQPEQLSAPPGG